MKKYYFTLAALAALQVILTSCNNEDVINDSDYAMGTEIKVNAMMNTDVTSRAVSNRNTTTDSLRSFCMWGFNDVNSIMNGDTYTKGVNDKYTTTNLYYWPTDVSKVKFYALAENNVGVNKFAKASNMTITAADGISITNYEVTVDGIMDDPVYAFASGKASKTDVDLVFNHLLSRVGVAVAYKSDIAKGNLQIRVLGYEFRNVGIKGNAKIGTDDSTDDSTGDTLKWSSQTKGWVKDTYIQESLWDDAMILTDGVTPVSPSDSWLNTNTVLYSADSWSNVIPGAKADCLMVACAVFDSNGEYIATRYLTKALSDTGSYKAGKQYIYNVYITNNGGGDTDGNDEDLDRHNDEDLNSLTIDVVQVTVAPWTTTVGGSAEFKN